MLLKENKYFIFDRPQKINIKFFIKKIKSYIGRIIFSCLYKTIHINEVEKKYNVSICAIFKDEAIYLKEWIEFHKIIGIEHFYLYNNISSDNYIDVLKPYIKTGDVTLIDWKNSPGQMSAYNDCVERFAEETKWIAFIDLDEYIVPNLYNKIYDFLKKYDKNYPVVIAYWRLFGTSGLIKRKNNLVIEDFIISAEKYSNIGKCFYNTSFSYADDEKKNDTNVHARWGKYKRLLLPPVNVYGKICICGENPAKSGTIPVQINHYLLKSYDEYIDKKSRRGGGVHGIGFHNMNYFYDHEKKCTGVDYHIYKYLIELKLKL